MPTRGKRSNATGNCVPIIDANLFKGAALKNEGMKHSFCIVRNGEDAWELDLKPFGIEKLRQKLEDRNDMDIRLHLPQPACTNFIKNGGSKIEKNTPFKKFAEAYIKQQELTKKFLLQCSLVHELTGLKPSIFFPKFEMSCYACFDLDLAIISVEDADKNPNEGSNYRKLQGKLDERYHQHHPPPLPLRQASTSSNIPAADDPHPPTMIKFSTRSYLPIDSTAAEVLDSVRRGEEACAPTSDIENEFNKNQIEEFQEQLEEKQRNSNSSWRRHCFC
ncbi:unnamed protein product [Caenorhabditis brenneri]